MVAVKEGGDGVTHDCNLGCNIPTQLLIFVMGANFVKL
jgi:hypothetical protein